MPSTTFTSGTVITSDWLNDVNRVTYGIATSAPPASASATGVAGTITWDASYIYVCVAEDTWKRVAIATW